MGNKKRINIYVDEDEWDKLTENINCSRSEWINQMIIKQNRMVDKVDQINFKIQAIEKQEKALSTDKDNLIKQRDSILKQRKENEENIILREEAMSLIRQIYYNPDRKLDYIELDRVIRIASNNNLNEEVLLAQMEKEGIPVKDVPIVKEELLGDISGKGTPY